jgi:hypothetical protein
VTARRKSRRRKRSRSGSNPSPVKATWAVESMKWQAEHRLGYLAADITQAILDR